MEELTYKSINAMMGDEVVAFGTNEDGEAVIFQWEPFRDEEDGSVIENAYRVSFVSKCRADGEWWCHHIYHEDGTVEELFEYVGA